MPKKKIVEFNYETEKSYRWGLCMKLAKTLYRSTVPSHEIENAFSDIEEFFLEINNQ